MRSESVQGRLTYRQTQSANYMIYTLVPEDLWCDFQGKMMSQNAIEGILQYHYFAMDDSRELRYELSGLVNLEVYLSRKEPTAQVLAQIILQIMDILSRSESFLLDFERFLMAMEQTYIDLSTMRIFLVYIPVETSAQSQGTGLNEYLQSILYAYKGKMSSELSVLVGTVNGLLREPFPSFDALRKALIAALAGEEMEAVESAHGDQPPHGVKSIEKLVEGKTEKASFKPIGFDAKERRALHKTKHKSVNMDLFYLIPLNGLLLILVFIGWKTLLHMIGGTISTFLVIGLFAIPINYYGFKIINSLKGKPQAEENANRSRKEKSATGKKEKEFSKIKSSLRLANPAPIKNLSSGEAFVMEPAAVSIDRTSESVISRKTELLSALKTSSAYLIESGSTDRILLDRERFMIGRQRDLVDLCLSDATIGRIHAEITYGDLGSWIVDLNSKNGTRVNDERLVSNVPFALKEGDCIVFSNKAFYFRNN